MTALRPAKPRQPKPEWLKVRYPAGERYRQITGLLRQHNLHTVCEEADCPNIGECFSAGEAPFTTLGDVCTRSCGFCSVTSGRPEGLDLLEPLRLTRTIDLLTVGRYLHPDEYAEVREIGRWLGFAHVEAGPFVRSSYHAGEQSRAALVGPHGDAPLPFFDTPDA